MMKLKTLIFILQSLTVSGEYFYLHFRINYVRAVDACKQNGLQLVNVKTSEINGRASAYMGDKVGRVWSGLHYNASLSKFQWGDGEILHSADGLSWEDGQPDLSQGMECAYMKHKSGSFIYKMTSCKTINAAMCDGELVTEDLPRAWPSVLRYTKRNSTETNQDGFPGCVFERRGISGQVRKQKTAFILEDCAVMCKEDATCIYFLYVYMTKTWGGCITHKRITD